MLQALQGCKLLNKFYLITVLKYYLYWLLVLDYISEEKKLYFLLLTVLCQLVKYLL